MVAGLGQRITILPTKESNNERDKVYLCRQHKTKVMVYYSFAQTDKDYERARELFNEYALSIDNAHDFKNFDAELINIQYIYGLPGGGILLAEEEGQTLGCSCIRKLEGEIAELKRFYVKPASRGRKIGSELLKASIQLATDLGYKKIRLNSLPDMKRAQDMYGTTGFYEIPPYYDNGIPGTIFMEKIL